LSAASTQVSHYSAASPSPETVQLLKGLYLSHSVISLTVVPVAYQQEQFSSFLTSKWRH
jgi:hypothetical protein